MDYQTLMRDFPTEEVLSVVTGRLLCDMARFCAVLEYMSGEPVFTHQIPRIGREALPVLLECHPTLKQACDEAEQVNKENWQMWRDTWLARYGATIAVPRMSLDEHERIDPISEAAEYFPPEKLIVVTTAEKEPEARS